MNTRARTAWVTARQNRWLVLGVVATAALVVLVVLAFTGLIGGDDPTRRDAVAAYIEEVNATQHGVGIERDRVSKVYARARKDPQGLAGNIADLDRSTATLRRFDRRLRALEPPPEAAALHRRLVTLSAAEALLAAEIGRLGRFLPILAAERRAVGVAGTTLQRSLAATTRPRPQAAAFERFAVAAEKAAKPLAGAPVPSALHPVKAQELERSVALAVSARDLARAVDEGRAADVNSLVQRFGQASAGEGNAVERAAVIAFDRQARRINELRGAVAQERARLDRTLS